MKRMLVIALLISTVSAFAKIKTGEYNLGDCKISVSEWSDYIEVRAFKNLSAGYGKVLFNKRDQNISSVYLCNDPFSNNENTIKSDHVQENDSTLYKAKCGGTFESSLASASIKVNNTSGLIESFSSKLKVASMSYPNGAHSGPIKKDMFQVICN